MPLIEAALAFAITMLALSLIVSSFVELIHRAFKMREDGLEYMLKQLFDQVLAKYVKPLADAKEQELANDPKYKGKPAALITELAYQQVRDSFVERMTANRAAVGLRPDPTLAVVPRTAKDKPSCRPEALWWPGNTTPGVRPGNMWGGRRLTQLAPSDFMERLGSDPVGDKIANAAVGAEPDPAPAVDAVLNTLGQKLVGTDVSVEINNKIAAGQSAADAAVAVLKDIAQKPGIDINAEVKKAAIETGQAAADAMDTVLNDVAQKFDGFGKDAASYFEGRARFMSVIVAIVLAFAVHVDAVDLFKTYLRDPNARAKVIEQSQAVAAQYKASKEAIAELKTLAPKTDAAASSKDAKKPEEAKKAEAAKKAAAEKAEEIKKQVDELEKDAQTAFADAKATIKQYADLGVPLGWNDGRIDAANMWVLVWTCKELKEGKKERLGTLWQDCRPDDKKDDATAKDEKGAAAANEKGGTAAKDKGGTAAKDKGAAAAKDKKDGTATKDKKDSTTAKDKNDNTAAKGDKKGETAAKDYKGHQYKNIWVEVPMALGVWLYLILGGLLIGLGSPFWYDAVTGLTNLRNAVGGASGSGTQTQAAPATVAGIDKAQPVTPVGAFKVSNAARTP